MSAINKKRFFVLVPSVILGVLAVVGVVSAATTIGTDISTGGSLTVGPDENAAIFGATFPHTFTSQKVYTDLAATGVNSLLGTLSDPPADSTANLWGQYSEVIIPSSNSKNFSGEHIATFGEFDHNGTGNYGVAGLPGTGLEGEAFNDSSGNVLSYLAGVQAIAGSYGTGTIAESNGVISWIAVAGSGVITNAIQLHAAGKLFGGSDVVTNLYGLKVEDQTFGTNNWAIKTGLGTVSFGDNVGIGTTTPQSRLQVTNGANATTTVTIGELGLTTSKGCVNMNGDNGQPGSFYLNAARTGIVVEPNYCR